MKKTIYLLCFSLLFSIQSYTQMNKESREKIKTLKIAYLTEKLNLSAEEAQKFWPVYNKFDEQKIKLRTSNRGEIKKYIKQKGNINNIDDKEAKRLINLKLKNDKTLNELEFKFVKDISKIISHKKILQLQIAEMEFARKLMRKYKRRK